MKKVNWFYVLVAIGIAAYLYLMFAALQAAQ